MVLALGLLLLLAVTSTQAPACRDNQACADCDNTGRCTTECNTGYFGLSCTAKCSKTCKNDICKATGTGIEECTDGCIHGYYGTNCNIKCTSYYELNETYCLDVCSQHCKFVSSTTDTTRCLHYDASASTFCTSECQRESGECLHGCVDGWYGLRCSFPCRAGCSGRRCDEVGDCVDGCRSGYFGRDCESCDRCKNRTCDPHNGTCVDGCRPGYFGELCNGSCEVCRDGICDQETGACINGCDVSEGACELSCTSNCSMDYCLNATTCDADSKGKGINIWLPAGSVAVLLAFLMSNYICYRKGRAVRRPDLEDTHSPRQPTSRNSQHIYDEIKDEDMHGSSYIVPVDGGLYILE